LVTAPAAKPDNVEPMEADSDPVPAAAGTIRIVLADNHAVVRSALRMLRDAE